MPPLITVVIPTKDRWRMLEVTLTTALNQEGVALEVVVVDDGSAHPMPQQDWPWTDPRVRVVRHPTSRGVAAARNAGIRVARGGWLAFLDDDDLWAPDKLAVQSQAAADAGAQFVYAAALLIHDGGASPELEAAPPPEHLRSMLRSNNVIPAGASNVLADTGLVRRLGGFDPSLRHLADWDLWIRLADAAAGACCGDALVGYRIHRRSMRCTDAGVLRELRVMRARYPGFLTAPADRIQLCRWLAGGQILAGRRLAAASTYVWCAMSCRSWRELADAVRTLVRPPRRCSTRTIGPTQPPDRESPALPPWLENALVSDLGACERPAAGTRSRLRRAAREAVAARARSFAARLITRGLQFSSLKAGVALVYHEIGDASRRPGVFEVVPIVDEALFRRQLCHLRRRYETVTAGELPSRVAARRRGERFPVALTFDDDLRAHWDVAAPALRRYDVSATFFLTGASLDGPVTFWWERLQAAIDAGIPIPIDEQHTATRAPRPRTATAIAMIVERLAPDAQAGLSARLLELIGGEPPDAGLRTEHVRALARSGFEIGFHTRRHRLLPNLSEAEMWLDLTDGRAELERAAGQVITTVAYPHGAADERTAAAAIAAGYRCGYTTRYAALSPEGSDALIGRLYPSRTSPDRFELQIARALWGEASTRWRPKVRKQ